MAAGPSEIAIVLVTTNCLRDVERLVPQLRAQEGVCFELIVVDNASSDGTREFLEAQRDLRLIANPENRWLSPAWAQGVRATRTPYVLLLTPDTALPPDTLVRLREALAADPTAALAGPELVDEHGRDQLNGRYAFPTVPWIVLSALGLTRLFGRDRPPQPPALTAGAPTERPRSSVVAFVNGACMLVRRSALDAIGGLDERFQLYWEEVDLARRLANAGYRTLLVHGAVVVHRGKGTALRSGLRRQTWAHGERIYLRSHHRRPARMAVHTARVLERARQRLGEGRAQERAETRRHSGR